MASTKTTRSKKAPTTTKKRVTRSKTKATTVKSFRPAKAQSNFFVFQPSIQTVYWLIIGVLVVALAAWTLSLQIQITEIYDSIDATSHVEVPVTTEKKPTN